MAIICKAMDISTVHVPRNFRIQPGESPDFGSIRCAEHDYGWVLFVPDEDGVRDYGKPVPAWLEPILRMAWDSECMFVNFDADAEVCYSLPIYEEDV